MRSRRRVVAASRLTQLGFYIAGKGFLSNRLYLYILKAHWLLDLYRLRVNSSCQDHPITSSRDLNE